MEEENIEQNIQLDGGTYEILRKRLQSHALDLNTKLSDLNNSRKDVFGSIETKLLDTQRVTTDHNCIPWDIFTLDQKMIFGYNVHLGLKTEVNLDDVLSIFEFTGKEFKRSDLSLLSHPAFLDDFKNLYKYYKGTQFVKFFVTTPYLYMVFKIGKGLNDVKAFKWLIENDGLTYIDARSEHDIKYPQQHEFDWKKTARDQHREGTHPHISIEDKIFVESIGGDLTVKVENNTETGRGIYSEEVDILDQTLDDADIHYSVLDNLVLLKIKPYQEKKYRHLVYNEKVQNVQRIDAIEGSCVLLPDDQGLIFSQGYYLQNGEYKLFDNQLDDMLFEKKVPAPNGEDYLYVFFNKAEGLYLLLIYNIIQQEVQSPITCHGYTLLENGQLLYFKSDNEAKKHHAIQIWQTPFVDSDLEFAQNTDSLIFKIGNRDVVKAMSECFEIINLINKGEGYKNVYFDILKKSSDLLDNYYWLQEKETFILSEALTEIKATASSAIGEYDKVQNIKKSTAKELDTTINAIDKVEKDISRAPAKDLEAFVTYLGSIRKLRGSVVGLKDLKFIDLKIVQEYEDNVAKLYDEQSNLCAKFLEKDEALVIYKDKVSVLNEKTEEVAKVIEINKLEEEITAISGELEMLIDMVSNLKIEDATQTTRIIDNISTIYSSFNQIKAAIKRKRKGLQSVEAVSEFNAQLKLLDQGVINYIDLCDTPEKCEEYLTKLMVQLEELEGKFSDFEEFIEKISIKRDEIYNAFDNKKVTIIEARNRKATALMQSAERILKASSNKIKSIKEESEINTYFASDLMINKLRDIVEELIELGDTVKADDLQSRLKSSKSEVLRQLKDKNDLFVEGSNIIKLGNHQFTVSKQNTEISMVFKNDLPYFHINGTNFFEEIEHEELTKNLYLNKQLLPSENSNVYRSEFLAYSIFTDYERTGRISELEKLVFVDLQALVAKEMALKFNEGYIKGVNDFDAALILTELVKIFFTSDTLAFSPISRTLARIWWNHSIDASLKDELKHQVQGAGMVKKLFPTNLDYKSVIESVSEHLNQYINANQFTDLTYTYEAAEYLFEEINKGKNFGYDDRAVKKATALKAFLKEQKEWDNLQARIDHFEEKPLEAFKDVFLIVNAFNQESPELNFEICELVCFDEKITSRKLTTDFKTEIDGLLGTHQNIENQKYSFDYYEYKDKLNHFNEIEVPNFKAFVNLKSQLIKDCAEEMRLEEFKPRVMSSFVRNKLIDKVYLKLIGENLAKQIGTAGESKRTDLMGMLLLISPPGYGKTTLMEYIADRLGLIFMKINGPAIGHEITSVDPAMAQNSGAREELKKLNLSFEMGDNVMIYLDDIQHCNPEFLQKFISLCDGQRKIEGVYKGKPKTYDFRGKKVCVVMAGNPYTESGEKFQIPDMLANRADIYNLGDIIGDTATEFKLSYVENCLTSNTTLSKVASKNMEDVYALIQGAEDGNKDGIDLKGNYGPEEVNELVTVTKKILRVRDVILTVNMEYIHSAGQNDQYRTEPPFRLQGSYRNMNKIVEKIVPIMNDEELETLILSHYENECQTLTTGSEANLLKFKELIKDISEEEQARWDIIKTTFAKNTKLKGYGDDSSAQVVAQLSDLTDGITGIGNVIKEYKPKESSSETTVKNTGSMQLEGLEKLTDTFKDLFTALQSNQEQIIKELGDQHRFDAYQKDKEEKETASNDKKKQERLNLIQSATSNKQEELEKMLALVSVGIADKSSKGNLITFDFVLKNESPKALKHIKGALILNASDGKEIEKIQIDYTDGLKKAEQKIWQTQLEINLKSSTDILLKEIPLEDLVYDWVPMVIR